MFVSKKTFVAILFSLLVIILGFVYIFSPVQTKPKRIAILFYQNSPTTMRFLNGFKTSLAQQGYYPGKNLFLYIENFQNASPRTTSLILKKIAKKHVHLLITTGKDLTITTAHTLRDKPIIYTLVSRPITEETLKTIVHEKNITGVSYFTPYDRTLELAQRLIPNFKRLVIILPSDSTWPDYDRLQNAAKKVGIKLTRVITPLSKIEKTISALNGRTDAVFLPYDIQLIFQADRLKAALIKAKLPAISNNLEYQSGCVLTYYAEPETIGEIAGRMAVKVFHGAKAKQAYPKYLPVELSSYYKLTVNLALLNKLNININEDVLSYANEVIR